MKAKRVIAAAAALCLTSASFIPSAYCFVPGAVPAITASAAGTNEDGKVVYEGDMTLWVYEDHAVLAKYSRLAEGEAVIPSEYNGVPITGINGFAFDECKNLTSVTIPDSVKSIRNYAFMRSGMTEINLPESIEDLSTYTFEGSAWLEAKRAENPLVIVNHILIDGRACKGEVVIPEGVKKIASFSFVDCDAMTSVSIPDSVREIGESAFASCDKLTDLTIPAGITAVSDYLFTDCKGLTSVTIPENITSIGERAFAGCVNIRTAELPGSLTEIGEAAFQHCYALREITIPASVEKIGNYAFEHCGLTSFTLPSTVRTIGDGILNYCESLTDITLPENLECIPNDTFTRFSHHPRRRDCHRKRSF